MAIKTTIRGKNIELTDAIINIANKKIKKIKKYLDNNKEYEIAAVAKIHNHPHEEVFVINLTTDSKTYSVTSIKNDLYESIDDAVNTLERKLRKDNEKSYKNKRRTLKKAGREAEVETFNTLDTEVFDEFEDFEEPEEI